MKLLGGLVHHSQQSRQQLAAASRAPVSIEQEFQFHPATGAIEMQLQQLQELAHDQSMSHAQWVTELLLILLAQLGNADPMPATATPMANAKSADLRAQIRALCVADRHYILWQWRLRQSSSFEWQTAQCPACDAHYDFPLDWRALPIKPPGASYPFAQLELAGQSVWLRVPNGEDQEFLAQLPANCDARSALAQRLILAPPAQQLALNEAAIAALEAAVEAAAPELADRLQLTCPECGCEHQVLLDLYRGLVQPAAQLLDDVHRLAAHYHWSEQDILALPKTRRQAYLARLERDSSRGMRP